jgi:hypothetical protein
VVNRAVIAITLPALEEYLRREGHDVEVVSADWNQAYRRLEIVVDDPVCKINVMRWQPLPVICLDWNCSAHEEAAPIKGDA